MKRAVKISAALVVAILLFREFGLVKFNYYRAEAEECKSDALALTLDRFKDIGSVEVVDLAGASKIYKISDSDSRIRLTVKDCFTEITWMQWLPFYKSGRSNVRVYFKVEKGGPEIGWNTWGCVAPLQTQVDLKIIGICSAYEYRRRVLANIFHFTEHSFEYARN